MAIQNRTYLKGRFQNGEKPDGTDFGDMIESSLNLSETNTLQKAVYFTLQSVPVTTNTLTLDLSTGNIFYCDITDGSGNFTFDYTNPAVGTYYFIFRRAANLAVRNITWATGKFKSSFGALPVLTAPTSTDDGEDIIMGIYVNNKMILMQQSNLIAN